MKCKTENMIFNCHGTIFLSCLEKMLLVNFLIQRKETVTTQKLSHEVKLGHLRQATRGYYLSLSLAIYWLMADKLKSLQSFRLQIRSDGQLR